MQIVVASLTVVAFCVLPALAQGVVADNAQAGELDRKLTAQVDQGFNGSVLVFANGEVILHKGYGWTDDSREHPITKDTVFNLASVSKQFTASAILELEAAGLLSLQDPIERYLADVPPDKRGITLHQLASHTSGLAQNYAADDKKNRDKAIKAILSTKLDVDPGTEFRYSNDNYTLLAAIVEIVSERTFEDYVGKELLEPAGLDRTYFWGFVDDRNPATVAQKTYEPKGNPNWGRRGGTGMFSTSGDLFAWYRALLEETVLSAEIRERLMGAHATARSGTLDVGYGWFEERSDRDTAVVWTGGAEDFGHEVILRALVDEGIVIVVFARTPEGDGAWRTKIWEMIESDLLVEP